MQARAEKLKYFAAKAVWNKVPKTRAQQLTGRPTISVRWVDIVKGTNEEPVYRSRLQVVQVQPASPYSLLQPERVWSSVTQVAKY